MKADPTASGGRFPQTGLRRQYRANVRASASRTPNNAHQYVLAGSSTWHQLAAP